MAWYCWDREEIRYQVFYDDEGTVSLVSQVDFVSLTRKLV